MRLLPTSLLSLVGLATACASTPAPVAPDDTCVFEEPVALGELLRMAPADRVPSDEELESLSAALASARGVTEVPDDGPAPFATGPAVSLVGAVWMPWVHCDTYDTPDADGEESLDIHGGAIMCSVGLGRLADGAITTLVIATDLELGLQTMPESVVQDGFGMDAVDVDGDGAAELLVALETEGESMRAIGSKTTAHLALVQPSGAHGPAVLVGTRGAASHETCLSELFVVDTDCDGRRELHIALTCMPGFCEETPDDPECADITPRKTRAVLATRSAGGPFELVPGR